MKTAAIKIAGAVQGVGFRPFVHRTAEKYKLNGFVRNATGSVYIEVTGEPDIIKRFISELQRKKPAAAVINEISVSIRKKTSLHEGFVISKSMVSDEMKNIIPDIAVCPSCLSEFNDKNNRRYHYPFINCTGCGPRFTIIKDVPYDRKNTSMKDFKMCPDCLKEYRDIKSRRYHAEPNACFVCGPGARLADRSGKTIKMKKNTGSGKAQELFRGRSDAVFEKAAELLKKGAVIAVKGIGGFHMAVDASNERAVQKLIKRKKRSRKPFAVMSDDIRKIEKFAEVNRKSRALLNSPEAPIVLLPLKKNRVIAPGVNDGLAHIGVFLAYSPLHHMLFNSQTDALVMTSGNISDEPIHWEDKEALKTLGNIADYFILHDREILLPADDSVVKSYKDRFVMIRRSRGFAPAPVILKRKMPRVFGAGGILKNTVCFIKENRALLSQHIGDIENNKAYDFYVDIIKSFMKFYSIRPEAAACDIHPDYLSSRFAEEFASEKNIPLVRVQHHYAHMAAVMAENAFEGKAIGMIFDGTGLGTDGNIWGGEFLTGDMKGFKRAGHFAYKKMPGGDLASKEAYRCGISVLRDFLSKDRIIKYYKDFPAQQILSAVENDINAPLSSSAGRLFDAAASILGICHKSGYDAQAPMKLEAAAYGKKPTRIYKAKVKKEDNIYKVDTAPLFAGLWEDRKKPEAAVNFHAGIARAAARTARIISDETGIRHAALSGGVFQNTVFLDMILKELKKNGLSVLIHNKLSPNDSCISFGQAYHAAYNYGKRG
ncbi:MAG: carbamoyltransferase HypF [Candidatus Goldiibacteriota bacterium]